MSNEVQARKVLTGRETLGFLAVAVVAPPVWLGHEDIVRQRPRRRRGDHRRHYGPAGSAIVWTAVLEVPGYGAGELAGAPCGNSDER